MTKYRAWQNLKQLALHIAHPRRVQGIRSIQNLWDRRVAQIMIDRHCAQSTSERTYWGRLLGKLRAIGSEKEAVRTLVKTIRQHPGLCGCELSDLAKIPRLFYSQTLRAAKQAKLIRREGRCSGAKWYAV